VAGIEFNRPGRFITDRLLMCFFGIFVFASSTFSIPKGDTTGIVYVVFAIDTEPSRLDPWAYEQSINLSCFDKHDNNQQVPPVMDDNWRLRYRDSRGDYPRFTWFIMSHEAFHHSVDGGCTIIYDALMDYRESIEAFGDELAWHYHHADWTDPDADGKAFWNQITTFDGTEYTHGTDIEIADELLNCLLVERGFFPASFRSGWTWENNGLSRWLDHIIPFDFSANPPNRGNQTAREPVRNQYDWSRTSRLYSGYHPNFDDYQNQGYMHRWVFRTIAPNNHREWSKVFRAAARGGDQILCYAGHSYDPIARGIDSFLPDLLNIGDSLGISVIFATASQAGAALSGQTASTPLEMQFHGDNDLLIIKSSTPIFQRYPYCVLVDSSGSYRRIKPLSMGTQQWQYNISGLDDFRIICAACNDAGISTVIEFH
jgi:hypothetical protein